MRILVVLMLMCALVEASRKNMHKNKIEIYNEINQDSPLDEPDTKEECEEILGTWHDLIRVDKIPFSSVKTCEKDGKILYFNGSSRFGFSLILTLLLFIIYAFLHQ